MPKNNAQKRFVDQPGQWTNTTSKKTMERQDKAWREFYSSLQSKPKGGTKKK